MLCGWHHAILWAIYQQRKDPQNCSEWLFLLVRAVSQLFQESAFHCRFRPGLQYGYLQGIQFPTRSITCQIFGASSYHLKAFGNGLQTSYQLYDCQNQSWTVRPLSYAGRLQLIKSVCSSIHVFWTSHLLLPKKIINKVEQMMRDFLWKWQATKKGGYKAAWRTITCPLREGGLGIKSICEWNSAAMVKHLWKLIQPEDTSLWAKWVRENLLKDRSIWHISAPQDSSWTWHKILSLRDKFKDCAKYQVGNGQLVFLWYDYWLPCGPLINLGELIYPVFELHKNAKVAVIIRHGQ